MVKKKGIQLGLDASQMSAVTGLIDGFSDTIKTDKLISTVVGYIQSELGREFGIAVDRVARAAPMSFLHVYEWGSGYHDWSTVGTKQARLWKLTQVGTGRSRAISFAFLPSVRPVPINPELEGMVNEGVHVFTWKAPIMEYGIRVTIKRKPGTRVLIYVDNETGEVKFRKGPQRPFAGGVSPYGKANQRGVFTSFFIKWWQSEGPRLFQTELKPRIERDIATPKKWEKIIRKYRPNQKAFSIQTTLQGHKSFASARKQAREELLKMGADYNRRSSQGRLGKFGY